MDEMDRLPIFWYRRWPGVRGSGGDGGGGGNGGGGGDGGGGGGGGGDGGGGGRDTASRVRTAPSPVSSPSGGPGRVMIP